MSTARCLGDGHSDSSVVADERSMRPCDVCLQVDDGPRHVHALAPDEARQVNDVDFAVIAGQPGVSATALQQYLDPFSQVRHLDCCRDSEEGCPGGTCGPQLAAAGDAKGDELLAAIQKEG